MYKLIKDPYTQKVNTVQQQVGNVLYSIPFDPDNSDYQAYLKWLELGNEPLPAENT